MQGYVNQSPVKQVWLPIDYDFINNHTDVSFGDFSKDYQKEYGIDLHDIFELTYKVSDDTFGLILKIDCVSCYLVGSLFGEPVFKNAKLVTMEAFKYYTYSSAQEQDEIKMAQVGINNNNNQIGYGFEIYLPAEETTIKSIDDLIIKSQEF